MLENPNPTRFADWIAWFRTRALRNGISGRVYDVALSDVKFNADVIDHDRAQPEALQTIWTYLDRAVTDVRVDAGQKAQHRNKNLLRKIGAKYGIVPEYIVAIWGLESNYGTVLGNYPVIGSLASLAFDGRRAGLFEDQLIAALHILQSGDVTIDNMVGSWAGAMGHTQFMPTSFRQLAVDFDRDGVRGIWGKDPCDALASTAAFLAAAGWQRATPCAVEIVLPTDFDFAQTGLNNAKSGLDWRRVGVNVELNDAASILVPAGATGPAFAVYENFRALMKYNSAVPYALAVSHLADRIAGSGPIGQPWPRDQPAMDQRQRQEFQMMLSNAGFDTKGVDGIFGPNTFAALRRFQVSIGKVADGFPTADILVLLRKAG